MGPAELDRLQETITLSESVPEIRARAADEFTRTIEVMAAPLARRAGRSPDDPAVRHVAGAMIGVIWAATMMPQVSGDPADLVDRIDTALAHLEQGLPL
jgi:hypothetical protein